MLASLLTPVLFSISVLCAGRSAAQIGPLPANFARLFVATLLLAAWAAVWGSGWDSGVFRWFFLSGCIGFGLGDIALFLAITRLGPRLTLMLAQCLAAPFAILIEWTWMETRLTPFQLLSGAVILTGVALALSGKQSLPLGGGSFRWGLVFGVLSALGQGAGAVLSRYAFIQAETTGEWVDPGSSAFQRILGGLLVAGLFFWFARRFFPRLDSLRNPVSRLNAWKWIILNALAGPTLGVACYQWALKTTPSGIVLPLVATAPIVVIPLAWAFNRDKPPLRSILGGCLAVAGVILLTRVS